MIKITFSEEDKRKLDHERYNHPHPRVQRKMEALWLKSQELPHKEICRLTGISKKTLIRYLKAYEKGGIEKLKEINFYCPKSKLAEHASTIEGYFRENPPATIKEAAAKIEELTGIKRSETQVAKFLKSIGMKRLKTGVIPAKADIEKQEKFKKEELEPSLEEARQGKRVVYFVDAAHFVFAPYIGFLWCFVRTFIKAPAGRQRFNVLGAINAITHELVTVTNSSYINALSVCQLFVQIANLYVDVPITLVLDNARYQKCALVRELAEALNIELLYLPSYSPNLNLIERLWKFVKKEVLYSEYYSDFESFKGAISDCLASTHTKHKKALVSLLTLNFQSLKKVSIMTS